MDYKQQLIFHKICDKYKLPKKNTFVQHRNLREFRYFFIERINPNHRIFLYGKFKKSMSKSNHFPNKIIKVGEILLYSVFFIIPTNNLFLDIELKFMSTMLIFSVLFDLAFDSHIMRFLNVDWNRRKHRVRKNNLCSKMC